MFRIRHLSDAAAPANRRAIAEIQGIIRDRFSEMPQRDIEKIPDQIADPIRYEFVSDVFVMEDGRGHIRAFAILLVDPALSFGFLELIATAKGETRGGLGATLYAHVREHALARGLKGIYFECLPDDPVLSPNPDLRKENAARLKFYERFGALPIMGTAYETPVKEGDTDSPYLVFDGIGEFQLPKASQVRKVVRAILERKYAHLCPPDYNEKVLASIDDKTMHLREPRYGGAKAEALTAPKAFTLPVIVNDKHDIHHIRERGYVEAPVRVKSILAELTKCAFFKETPAKNFPERWIKAVHDPKLADYIERACKDAPEGKSVYPYVFPVRNAGRMPKDRSVLAGYWCIDTFTPLNKNAYPAAREAVDCTLTAAEMVLDGAPAAYALVRPPGHHAEHKAFGGFCYFNNAAVAANYLSEYGRVAVLDVDYHHGNGTQDIFYERADVLTVSIHGDPSFAYPYFTGFKDETGRGEGAGFNLNLPLAETITADDHRKALHRALARIAEHDPAFLVIALGLDAAKGDPTGTWPYVASDFARMGEIIASAGLPTLFVQEGGYRVQNLGVNARRFFEGFASKAGAIAPYRAPVKKKDDAGKPLSWRAAVRPTDVPEIRRMVTATAAFSPEEVDIACELAETRIEKGRASGYEFIFAGSGDRLAGYSCYGRTPGAEKAYDLYWIVVDPDAGRKGLGAEILMRTEKAVAEAGGAFLIAETSSTPPYEKARAFYKKTGFKKLVQIADFYRPGDDKIIFRKDISNER
ncbi:GNAT family N-acetyltransferase [Hyphococcus sp.]|uniref:GNAT family N-acetyltransferase n=1 Tax=Hyphococcus sp. TaxID=2038636 RepID=UPI003D13C8C8